MINKRGVGSDYETLAMEYLEGEKYQILERNFHSRWGEIDIIARDGDYLVFVEVKYRKNSSCGNPLEAVDARKQKRICRTAVYYLSKNGYGDSKPCRFDVIAFEGEEVLHIKNAFEFAG
ncbi:MAG: YraN family protein [Lachnospiraceae bacterium]|nr:YraN family protein [Lachnospiraceae bacterium]